MDKAIKEKDVRTENWYYVFPGRKRRRLLHKRICQCGKVEFVSVQQLNSLCMVCSHLGPLNSAWKGDNAKPDTGRARAEKYFSLKACVKCTKEESVERHHIDGNPLNNNPSNVILFCRNCHMIYDGRSLGRLRGLKHAKRKI